MGSTSIHRLLIANRGEIAVRIARSARALGIDTVGVYSAPDADALHVDSVDVAVALGGSSPADSYLRGDLVLEAAVATGCDAVHPGYGFLAENAGFARSVLDAGLAWVGPTPEQIELLGDKVAAKAAAVEAGVPTTSALLVTDGAVPDGVSYPALVKAAAGGGGRGMRVVRSADDLPAALEAASREALSAFGDGTVFVEPYLEGGRHVEVQIMGDAHGAVIHLGDRECSIQRRNQKVIEEAPASAVDRSVREALWEGALALARHVGYVNAGTVEFLVGADGTINFLEVNTRLQVEHPVTEAVTGVDLVAMQLRVAAGEPLGLSQEEVSLSGHAIEARLVAEDPAAGWLPSGGTIGRFAVGTELGQDGPEVASTVRVGSAVRVDSGVRSGSSVSADYDSLVAKVIVHAADRPTAARRLGRVMASAQVTGVRTNAAMLAAVCREADYLAGATPTSYLDTHPDVLAAGGPDPDVALALLLAAALTDAGDNHAQSPTAFAPSGWRLLRTMGQRQTWACDGVEHHLEYHMVGPAQAEVLVGAPPEPDDAGALGDDERRRVQVAFRLHEGGLVAIEADGTRHLVEVTRQGDDVHTRCALGALSFTRVPRFATHDLDLAGSGPVCPLPGTVIAVHVEAGAKVGDGELLMVVEAMKMEHPITAAGEATVAEVRFGVGDRVDTGNLLVVLDRS
ncbi:MAG: biotin carboxylase N-terminal domain-containing protein [Microthrixaceae bacterium]